MNSITYISMNVQIVKQTLFTNWNFMRWLRLGFGLFLATQAVQFHDAFAGLIATFFLFQAATNTGCCGAGGCAVPASDQSAIKTQEVEFEEIKK